MKNNKMTYKELNDENFIVWNPKFETNILTVDNEHKRLVELCNAFYKSILQNQTKENWKETLSTTLRECAAYANYHFANEERLMKAANFQGYAHHKAEHEAFIEKVSETLKDFDKLTITDSINFAKFLYQWILSHIAHEDKLYIPKLIEYLKENANSK